ncbi:family 16 glycosylhydrolase [Pseudooceanicola sp. CBS1P-1]|uniref:Family 16 glycosylhydrolase n=1 Tax=Pseudooceanicola albus TaxID=2692189 RepID=A0A6L7G501_9RHOB|nr:MULTISPECIES: family 16 glycosylhydrolase [Pseudooceanicola]MBT9383017.1 family 16 glycosylhydrolase [Pseudooceanicola endophyticus]MXN19205.1 family 16 glycosylhydrolase [Pseudooceanicola albus]
MSTETQTARGKKQEQVAATSTDLSDSGTDTSDSSAATTSEATATQTTVAETGEATATTTEAATGSIDTITLHGETYVLTFDEEFDAATPSFWAGFGAGGIWATSFSPHLEDSRTIASNNELQYYVDPDMSAFDNPFSVTDGVLTITASPLDATQEATAGGLSYSSGMISTEMSFAFCTGYVEICADLPDEVGMWSAFWLMPADGDWSAEIDILEVLGEDADTLHTNVWDDGSGSSQAVYDTGAADGFHTYGLYWDESVIEWYYDGTLIRSAENTAFEDMYLIINLAVGGWAEDPDATTDFSEGLQIDYIRIYELESSTERNDAITEGGFTSQELWGGTEGADTINGSRWGDLIEAGGGDDIVYGDNGNDTLYGGDGADQLFGQNGSDALYGGAAADKLIGGNGVDFLNGGAGTDHLWGGVWAADGATDTFAFEAGCGTDYVHDFELGTDLIDLSSFGIGWDDLSSAMTDQGWATKIDLAACGGNSGDAVYLANVAAADLTADDILFATYA